ncbi:MAG: LPXTG cell wall anchor domain-containing protein [Bacilli bacterium]|nr:LPXTG cell wall anchor domain-containing protein [Bacilli bacterium]
MPEEEKPANNLLGTSDDTEESYNPLISYKNMDMNLISNKTDNKKCDSNLAMIIGLGISSILVGLFTFIFVRKKRKLKKAN